MTDGSHPAEGEIIFYTSPDGVTRVEVFFQDETVWLTINRMAELFGTTKQAISYHLLNIYDSGELSREATVKEILTVQEEGGAGFRPASPGFQLGASGPAPRSQAGGH